MQAPVGFKIENDIWDVFLDCGLVMTIKLYITHNKHSKTKAKQ